jgi:hypothetical protein
MLGGLYPKDASYSSDEVAIGIGKLVKNTFFSILAGILSAVFLFATAESRVSCDRDGPQIRCHESKALFGFFEVRKQPLPELKREEIRSRLLAKGGRSEIGEVEIGDFLSGRGPARVHTGERVPLSLLWWIICGFLLFVGVYGLVWFPIELCYWLSHKERTAR